MKSLAAALLCVLVVGCAAPRPSPRATPSPTVPPSTSPSPTPPPSPSPSATPAIAFTCYQDLATHFPPPNYLPSSYCPAEEVAVKAALAAFSYPIDSITVRSFAFGCGGPFPSGVYACPLDRGLAAGGPPTAYVTFSGIDKVAALVIARQRGGSVLIASVVAFEVPPAGWSR